MKGFHYLVLVLFGMLHFGGGATTIRNTDNTTTKPPKPGYDKKIESGIVFMQRGDVLLTGDDWIVAKEFNITDILTLLEEAKILFPNVKKYLENSQTIDGENIWDLQFFRDSVNHEIELVQPIINKIEEKVGIFQNMLPKNVDENPVAHKRNKRFFMDIFNTIVSVGRALFSNYDNKHEIQELNSKYDRMIQYQTEQNIRSAVQEMSIQSLNKTVTEIASEMKIVQEQLHDLRRDQDKKLEALNSRVDQNINDIFKLDEEVEENSENIKKLEKSLTIMNLVYDQRFEEISGDVENVKSEVNRVKTDLVKQYSIITDLGETTQENRKSINDVKNELKKAITNWERSKKQIVEKLNLVVNITSTMRMMEMRLLHIDTYLTGLLEALDTVATGRLSPNLVSPIQLVEILRSVSKNLPPGFFPLTLIEEDAVYEYYTYATVLAVAIPSAIRVFIKLPLKTPNRIFTLYEPYSLPFYHEVAGIFLEIEKPSDYVLVSKDHQKVAEIPRSFLKECKSKNKMYLCKPTIPLYEGTKCSLSLIKEDEEQIIKSCERSVVVSNFKSKWIRTEGGWIYSVPRPMRVTSRRDDRSPRLSTITGTGILRDIPHAYTHSADGTLLFPNDVLGDDLHTRKFKDDKFFIPKVPNLLLLNESSKIGDSDIEDVIKRLGKANSVDKEKVNIYHLMEQMKLTLTSELPHTSGDSLMLVLAVAVIVNYVIVGILCWGRTKKNVVARNRNDGI